MQGTLYAVQPVLEECHYCCCHLCTRANQTARALYKFVHETHCSTLSVAGRGILSTDTMPKDDILVIDEG
jgi:hypothetical protein